MAVQGYVQLPDDSGNTGKKEDHVVTDNGNYREVVSIGGPQVDSQYAPVSATAGLKVDLGADNDVTVTSGSITANAGTNLNTSALALEAGNIALILAVDGATTDAAVTGDNNGTLSAKLRGINKILANVWDSVNSRLNVFIQNTTLAVTQSGTWSVTTAESAPTTIYNGKKTVTTAGTRVTLAGSQTIKSVTVKALRANTGTIYVGDASVASTNGFALAPGETVSMDIADLVTVNIDSSVNGEGVTYIAVN